MFLVSVFLFIASRRENVLVLKFENILHCGNKKYLLSTPLKMIITSTWWGQHR